MSVPLTELSSWKKLKRYREEAIHILTQNAAILRGGHNVVPQVWGCVLGLSHGFCDRLVYYDCHGSGTFQSNASGPWTSTGMAGCRRPLSIRRIETLETNDHRDQR